MRRRLPALVVLLCAAAFASARANDDLDAAFERDVLVISAGAYACYRFDIYLALDDAQKRRGLMHVRKLPARTGMLFVYDGKYQQSMWMKNTYIPLDIVFARDDGRVSSIASNTEPQSLRSIASIEPVKYVLELNAGTTARLSIDESSRLLWGETFGFVE